MKNPLSGNERELATGYRNGDHSNGWGWRDGEKGRLRRTAKQWRYRSGRGARTIGSMQRILGQRLWALQWGGVEGPFAKPTLHQVSKHLLSTLFSVQILGHLVHICHVAEMTVYLLAPHVNCWRVFAEPTLALLSHPGYQNAIEI